MVVEEETFQTNNSGNSITNVLFGSDTLIHVHTFFFKQQFWTTVIKIIDQITFKILLNTISPIYFGYEVLCR